MTQIYDKVFIESLGLAQPTQIVTSEQLEERLSPLYKRLNLPEGRLQLMTGIRERRFCEEGAKPSDLGVEAAEAAFAKSNIDRSKIGCLIHSSVCRDFLEPATATVVHDRLGLNSDCQVFDLSNACLGFLNAMAQVANMIELGQIEAGLVVSGEDGRALVESTIKYLNENLSLTRRTIKASFASLTIGSGGVAVILSKAGLAKNKGHQFCGTVSTVATQYHKLCQGGVGANEATTSNVVMSTDSEGMLEAGIDLAHSCFLNAKRGFGVEQGEIDHFITHQVGVAHSKKLFSRLELDETKDYPTFPVFGNMGSASIGSTLTLASDAGRFEDGQTVMMMGIGSGLVSMMAMIKW